MIRKIIKTGNVFLNAFGNKDTIRDGMTPRNIIDNLPHVDYNDFKHKFGEYVQLHMEQKFTNNMKSRTIGAIVMGPNNVTGTYTYMSLETEKEIDGRVVQSLPLTQKVIDRVEELGLEQNQPFSNNKALRYKWRPGTPIVDHGDIPPAQAQLEVLIIQTNKLID